MDGDAETKLPIWLNVISISCDQTGKMSNKIFKVCNFHFDLYQFKRNQKMHIGCNIERVARKYEALAK